MEGGTSMLTEILEKCRANDNTLIEIDIQGQNDNERLDDKACAELADALQKNTNMECLKIENCELGGGAMRAFASLLGANCALTSLILKSNGLNDDAVELLAPGLSGHPTLCTLNLSNNRIGAAGVRSLCTSLDAVGTVLEELVLDGNPVMEAGATALVQLLQSPKCQLEELSVKDAQLDEPSVLSLIGQAHQNAMRGGMLCALAVAGNCTASDALAEASREAAVGGRLSVKMEGGEGGGGDGGGGGSAGSIGNTGVGGEDSSSSSSSEQVVFTPRSDNIKHVSKNSVVLRGVKFLPPSNAGNTAAAAAAAKSVVAAPGVNKKLAPGDVMAFMCGGVFPPLDEQGMPLERAEFDTDKQKGWAQTLRRNLDDTLEVGYQAGQLVDEDGLPAGPSLLWEILDECLDIMSNPSVKYVPPAIPTPPRYSPSCGSGALVEPPVPPEPFVPLVLQVLINHMPAIARRLATNSQGLPGGEVTSASTSTLALGASYTHTGGTFQRVGVVRLKLVQVARRAVGLGYEPLCEAMASAGVVQRVTDLFFASPWCSLLHVAATELMCGIMDADPTALSLFRAALAPGSFFDRLGDTLQHHHEQQQQQQQPAAAAAAAAVPEGFIGPLYDIAVRLVGAREEATDEIKGLIDGNATLKAVLDRVDACAPESMNSEPLGGPVPEKGGGGGEGGGSMPRIRSWSELKSLVEAAVKEAKDEER